MIKKIIRFSAENRLLVIACGIIALFISFWAMRTIPLDALPDLSDTQVIVYSSGTAARTRWRTRSPTPSSPPCWARPRSRRCGACRTSASPTST